MVREVSGLEEQTPKSKRGNSVQIHEVNAVVYVEGCFVGGQQRCSPRFPGGQGEPAVMSG